MSNASKQTDRYHQSMAGEFFVNAQLQRMKISASVTYGNAKGADVVAFSNTTGKAVIVEVKTSGKGRWPVGNRPPLPSDQPWVFVHLPDEPNLPPEFYVLPQSELHTILQPQHEAFERRYLERHGEPYGDKPGVAAIKRSEIEKYRNNWAVIANLLK